VAQGSYLVNNVGMCGDCHTPFTAKGQPDRSRWLAGATLEMKPLHPVPNWARSAPAIAGLPVNWSATATIHFLETGLQPDGTRANPPMPGYRLSKSDAKAVVAYLKSLPRPRSHSHRSI
jgi:mono/diheme cytochrome c family protein